MNPFLVHLCREESRPLWLGLAVLPSQAFAPSFCRLCFRGAQADEGSDLALPGRSKRSNMGAVGSIVARSLSDHRPNQGPLDSTCEPVVRLAEDASLTTPLRGADADTQDSGVASRQ